MNQTITQKVRGRPVTHEEASMAAQRLVNSHFNNEDRARMSIPVRAEDDDVLLSDYIREQQDKEQNDVAVSDKHIWVEVGGNEMETKYECSKCLRREDIDHLGFSLEILGLTTQICNSKERA